MTKLSKGVYYIHHTSYDRFEYIFFHYHDTSRNEDGWYPTISNNAITEEGTCSSCREFIAPYKKLEVMVKLKEFQGL